MPPPPAATEIVEPSEPYHSQLDGATKEACPFVHGHEVKGSEKQPDCNRFWACLSSIADHQCAEGAAEAVTTRTWAISAPPSTPPPTRSADHCR